MNKFKNFMPRQTKKFNCKYSELKNSFIISSPKKETKYTKVH